MELNVLGCSVFFVLMVVFRLDELLKELKERKSKKQMQSEITM